MTPHAAPLILVTTAGKIGAEASRLLAQRGVPVRVLVRNPVRVTALAKAGVDVRRSDLEVRALLAAPADDEREPEHRGLPPVAISRAERLIAEAMDRPDSASPTLRELAATACISPNHLIRKFRQMRGTTPHQLVMTRRCQRAMELLRQPDVTIADVSDAAGYSSPAYFVASFRQQLGVTPGAYQRAVAGKG